jgi:hypothetical protein
MYKVTAKHVVTEEEGIVKVYFINEMPFTYDSLDDIIKEDEKILKEAINLPTLSIEEIHQKSAYLLEEGLHPLLNSVELHPESVLPDMLS